MAKHYLFAMWEGGGNVPPLLGVARRLMSRGHRVTVLGDPTIEDEAARTGCGFMPWRRAPHRTTLQPEDDLLRDWEIRNPFTQLSNYRDKLITEPAARYAADTLEALDATSADVLVTEYTIFGAFMAAEKRGLPAVGLVPNIWPMPAAGAPPGGRAHVVLTHGSGSGRHGGARGARGRRHPTQARGLSRSDRPRRPTAARGRYL